MKLVYSAFVVLFPLCLTAQEVFISFLTQPQPIKLSSFMDFMELSPATRTEFQSFYYDIVNNLRTVNNPVKKHNKIQKLKEQGMNSLEIKYPQWARQLHCIVQKTDHELHNAAHIFVIRSAALESFYEHKARQKNTMWVKVKNFVGHTKQTFAEWFSFLNPKRTLT